MSKRAADSSRKGAAAGVVGTNADPRVSVIMIFHDAGRFIGEAIRSVLAQSVPDWELVLVDDGSTDASRDIAMSWVDREPGRIRLFEHPGSVNRGTGASRNLGMQMARGRYLTFLDADDVYEPRRLERCAALLDADPSLGVVISHDLYWRRWPGNGADAFVLPDEVVGPAVPVDHRIAPPRLIAATLATPGAPMPAICGITFRRAAVERLGGIPEQFDSQYEDQALIVKLLMACPAIVVEDCLARYRQHPESLTHRARRSGEYRPGRPHQARRAFLEWMLDYMSAAGADDPLMRGAIEAELAEPPRDGRIEARSAGRGYGRTALLRAFAHLPSRPLDAVILRWWALRRARVARRTAAKVSGRGDGHTR